MSKRDPDPASIEEALQRVARMMSEAELTEQFLSKADAYGWSPDLRFHDVDARREVAGLPDWMMINEKQHRLIFVELKAYQRRGTQYVMNKLSKPQARWFAALRAAGQEVYVVTPDDLLDGTMERMLQHA